MDSGACEQVHPGPGPLAGRKCERVEPHSARASHYAYDGHDAEVWVWLEASIPGPSSSPEASDDDRGNLWRIVLDPDRSRIFNPEDARIAHVVHKDFRHDTTAPRSDDDSHSDG